ncbi:CbtA family protein [Rhizohabitans arisaemae]|uniref:CbtA family protein n=1 Tax=Rhizohabitans arisaemae TaxID=2720610 RepID=UPI0024B15CBE|nr:CbtA family protein [Rhizohabitans arisaemae]
MIRTLLVRGLLVGLVAGLIAAVFAYVVGEPDIDRAIALEEAAAAAESGTAEGGHSHDEPLVSRPGQRFGLFLALGLYGLSVGGIFALAFAGLRGRVGPRSEGALAITMAAVAFAAVVLFPFLKYPANPPAVGDPETIGTRTTLYLVMVLLGLLSVAVAVTSANRLSGRGPAVRRTVGAAGFLIPVVAGLVLLPTVDEVPAGFPGTLLWDFRVASLGTQLVLWAALGVLFGILSERAARRTGLGAAVRAPVPS